MKLFFYLAMMCVLRRQ